MTGALALHFNLTDRGLIEVGRRADLNLIDLDKSRLARSRW